MCENLRKSKRKSVTGYKFVWKDENGKYFSPFAGTVFKAGKISKKRLPLHTNDFEDKGERGAVAVLFENKMIGNVSIFKNKRVAIDWIKGWRDVHNYKGLVLLGVGLSNNIHLGEDIFNDSVFVGSNVDYIKELKVK